MAEPKLIKVTKDTVILKEGEQSEVMYKILKGHAEMYLNYGEESESLLGIIGEQSCFGEFGLLTKKPAIYTVTAYSELLLLRITEADFGSFIVENHKNIQDIMRNMADSMMVMHFQIELLNKEILEYGKNEKNREAIKDSIRNAKQLMKQYAVYSNYRDHYDDKVF